MSCLTLNSVQPFTETRANYTTKKNLFNSLSANPTKWSNTLKQFFGNFPTDCLSVLDHFVGLMLNRSSPYETSLMELFHKNSYGSLLLTSFTKSSLKHAQQRHITFNILWKLLIKNSEKLQKILSFQKTSELLHLWDHLFSTQAKFSEKRTCVCVCVSGGKKCQFFGKFCIRTKWMIRIYIHTLLQLLFKRSKRDKKIF